MATFTCSIFLKRDCLVSYNYGKSLLAANGPFVELFDVEKLRNGNYDANKENPVRTRVTESSSISHILPLESSGHVVVITSESRHQSRSWTAHLLHRDLIENGGYSMPSSSFLLKREEDVIFGDTSAQVLPGRDEFLLATSTFAAHFRVSFPFSSDGLEASILPVDEFDLRSIINEQSRGECLFAPCALAPSLPLNLMLRTTTFHDNAQSSLLFLHTGSHPMKCAEMAINISAVQAILPSLEVGIICDDKDITVVQARAHSQKKGRIEMKTITRVRNPYNSPKKICAIEDKNTKSAIIIIISEEGISSWKYENRILKKLSEFNPQTPNMELRKIIKFEETMVDFVGFVDAEILPKSKNGINSWDLVISRKTGAIVVFCDELKETKNLEDLLIIEKKGWDHPVDTLTPCWKIENDELCATQMYGESKGATVLIDMDKEEVIQLSTPIANGKTITNVTDELEAISVCFTSTSFEILQTRTSKTIFAGSHECELPDCWMSDRFVAFYGGSKAKVIEHCKSGSQIQTYQCNVEFCNLQEGEKITHFHVQKIDGGQNNRGIFGSSEGRIFTVSLCRDHERSEMGEVHRLRMYEEIMDMKCDSRTGNLIVLGRKGQILVISNDALLERGTRQVEAFHVDCNATSKLMGIMTIMAWKREERHEVLVMQERDSICLLDLPSLRQIFKAQVSEIENLSFFARFVGDVENNQLRMFICGVDKGKAAPLKVIKVECRLHSDARYLTEASTLSRSILPPTSTSTRSFFILRNWNDKFQNSAYVVSIGHLTMECMKLNKKGILRKMSKVAVKGTHLDSIGISCTDVRFRSDDNSAHILIGGETGEVHLRILDQMVTSKLDRRIRNEQSRVRSIRFFQDEFTGKCLNHYALLTRTRLRVCRVVDSDSHDDAVSFADTGILYDHQLTAPIEWKDCNMIAMGDGKIVHDVWLLSDYCALLIIGRNGEKRKPVGVKLDQWKGAITASCGISTKKKLDDTYIDVVAIAKEGRIGVLTALHMEDDPADVILFSEWKISQGSAIVGIHTELLNVIEIENGFVLGVRLYVLKKNEILRVYHGRVISDGAQLSVDSVRETSKIHTSVRKPFQLSVSSLPRIETKPDVEPPKFAVVGGVEGTQVVRICRKELIGLDSK